MAVPFRFDTVLRVRESERDQCRVALAREELRQSSLQAEQHRLLNERTAVLNELRSMNNGCGWSVDQALVRQQHAEHLVSELSRITAGIAESRTVIEQCLRNLIAADIAVKALEKLAGRHVAIQRQIEQTGAERDRDDAWRAA